MTGLVHRLDIPIDAAGLSRVAEIENIAVLTARRIQIIGAGAFIGEVVAGQVAGSDIPAFETRATKGQAMVGDIVEYLRIAILNGLRQVADITPLSVFVVCPDRIVSLPYIRTIAHGNEPLQIERHFLASDAKLEYAGTQRADPCHEGLLQVHRILVDGRDRIFPKRPRILDLGKTCKYGPIRESALICARWMT